MRDIRDKIRSLLRLSLSSNPHEAALAFERAKRSAAIHDIDIRDFFRTDSSRSGVDFIDAAIEEIERRVNAAIAANESLAAQVAEYQQREQEWETLEQKFRERIASLEGEGAATPPEDFDDEYPVGLRLRNTWEYDAEEGCFTWHIFLTDGGTGALRQIRHVTYVLHETFAEPIQRVINPDGGFRLGRRGWGTFTIPAQVTLKNGMRIDMSHNLELYQRPRKGITE